MKDRKIYFTMITCDRNMYESRNVIIFSEFVSKFVVNYKHWHKNCSFTKNLHAMTLKHLYCLALWLRRLGAGLADLVGSATWRSVFWRLAPRVWCPDVALWRIAGGFHGAHAHCRLKFERTRYRATTDGIRSRDPTHSRRTDHNDFFCYTLFQR